MNIKYLLLEKENLVRSFSLSFCSSVWNHTNRYEGFVLDVIGELSIGPSREEGKPLNMSLQEPYQTSHMLDKRW
jgi:hypothetical protein